MKQRTQVALVTVLALVGLYIVGDALDITPGMLTVRPVDAASVDESSAGGAESTSPGDGDGGASGSEGSAREGGNDEGGTSDANAMYAGEALTFNKDAALPDQSVLDQALATFLSTPAVARNASVEVVDVATGKSLISHEAATPRVPASNEKVPTAFVALTTLGGDFRPPTVASLDGTTLYLIGGGDVLLAADAGDDTQIIGRAGLGDLARAAAKKLQAKGVTAVDLQVDTSLFSGPHSHESWDDSQKQYAMDLAPIAINRGKVTDTKYKANPQIEARDAFAAALGAAGITVTSAGEGKASAQAKELARVEGPSVRQMVDKMLTISDNSLAEVLGHLVAHKLTGVGDFEHAAQATMKVLREAGMPMEGVQIADNSGLSDRNHITTGLQVAILQKNISCGEKCTYAPLSAGLPVMGLNGTLASRGGAIAGRVHAKTGTLVSANSLSGYAVTQSGRLLTFSILVDNVTPGATHAVRPAQDDFLTAILGA